MYQLLVGNDTVPISVCCGRDMRCAECRLVNNAIVFREHRMCY